MKKLPVYFCIGLSSIIYYCFLYWGAHHGGDFGMLIPFIVGSPIFIVFLLVCIYKGWGLKGLALSLILIPLNTFLIAIGTFLFIFVYMISVNEILMIGTWLFLSLPLTIFLLNKFEKSKKLK